MQSNRVLCIETMSLVQGLFTVSMWSLNFIRFATDYFVHGNEIIEYCGVDVHSCFFMQATEHVAMPLTYVIRMKQTCINYEYFLNLCLM